MTSQGGRLLKIGGVLSFAIAFFHVLIVIIGVPAYRFFSGIGAELADLVKAGSVLPALITLLIALVFVIFGCYALSGAGVIRRLPLLRTGLISIGGIYLLRGLMNIPFWLTLTSSTFPSVTSGLIFDAISLTIGLLYVCGTAMNWRNLRTAAADRPSSVPKHIDTGGSE